MDVEVIRAELAKLSKAAADLDAQLAGMKHPVPTVLACRGIVALNEILNRLEQLGDGLEAVQPGERKKRA